MSTYYLDFANQIISYLDLDDEENENVKNLLKKLPFHIRSYGVKVVIPQISFGEAVSELYSKFRDKTDRQFTFEGLESKISKLLLLVKNMQADLKPATREAISVYNILSEDIFLADKLGPVDLLILSQAISDPDADHLFTMDLPLINSQTTNKVKELIKQYKGEKGFVIKEDI
jgi:hypothetical protein